MLEDMGINEGDTVRMYDLEFSISGSCPKSSKEWAKNYWTNILLCCKIYITNCIIKTEDNSKIYGVPKM